VRPLLSILTACALLQAAGCVELERKRVTFDYTIDGLWTLRRPGEPAAVAPSRGLEGEALPRAESYYRVGKTDTLVNIAERFYGSRLYVRRIRSLNRDQLDRTGGLERGMILKLPPAAEENEAARTAPGTEVSGGKPPEEGAP